MAPPTIARFNVHDFSFQGATNTPNPFAVTVTATFEHDSGAKIANVPCFYSGNTTWTARFSPGREGSWRGSTSSENDALDGINLGEITCTPQENQHVHGTLGVDPKNPRRFAWEDGTPCIALGFECDWLFSYHQRSPSDCCRHIDRIAEHGFNLIMTNVYAHTGFSTGGSSASPNEHLVRAEPPPAEYVYGPPDIYVFGGANEAPDHTVLNTGFFDDFDRMIHYLHGKGIIAHLMIQVQNKKVKWPKRLSPEDDIFWRYVVARYQAFGNVIWDISKESVYLLRETGSHDYTINRVSFIKTHDAYHHLVTAHDTEWALCGANTKADLACDFVADQVHLGDPRRLNMEAIRRLRILPRPYMNNEYGYEPGVDEYQTYYNPRTTAPWQEVLKWTWSLYTAGAYACYYYTNTSWDLIKFEPEPEGWQRYRYMIDFLEQTSFNSMAADNQLVEKGFCLAKPGKEYLAFLPDGGDLIIDLVDVGGSAGVTADWLNIYSGRRECVRLDEYGFLTEIENPFDDKTKPVAVFVKACH